MLIAALFEGFEGANEGFEQASEAGAAARDGPAVGAVNRGEVVGVVDAHDRGGQRFTCTRAPVARQLGQGT